MKYDGENSGQPGLPGESGESDADFPNVAYASNAKTQVMDIFLPEKATGSDPVIVLVHGGGFAFGSQAMEIIRPIIEAGTANGYVVASVHYRKSSEAAFPGTLSDVKAAVRYLRVNALVSFYAPVEFWTMDDEYKSMGREDTTFSTGSSFESKFVGQAIGQDKEKPTLLGGVPMWISFPMSLPSRHGYRRVTLITAYPAPSLRISPLSWLRSLVRTMLTSA